MYFINGAWDILIVVAIAYYWIETKGKSLEEIDASIEGVRYSDVSGIEDVIRDEDVQVLPAK